MRYTVRWNGFIGAPGFTNLHFLYGSEDLSQRNDTGSAVKAFLGNLNTYLPSGVSLTFPTAVDIFDEEDGTLISTLPIGAQTAVTGTATGTWSSVTGGVVSWGTNVIRNGRRLRGRTFLVPLGQPFFSTDGTPLETARTAIQSAAQGLIDNVGGPPLVIWARPGVGGSGVAGIVNSVVVPDTSAVLKSRRD